MKDSKDTTSKLSIGISHHEKLDKLMEAVVILDLLKREGMPTELPIEHRRKRRKRKFTHGKMHCLECGFCIRGLHHATGEHHRQGQGTWTDAKGEMHSSKGRCTIAASAY